MNWRIQELRIFYSTNLGIMNSLIRDLQILGFLDASIPEFEKSFNLAYHTPVLNGQCPVPPKRDRRDPCLPAGSKGHS